MKENKTLSDSQIQKNQKERFDVKKYEVNCRISGRYTFCVEAKSMKEAKAKVEEKFNEIWEETGIDCGELTDTGRCSNFLFNGIHYPVTENQGGETI